MKKAILNILLFIFLITSVFSLEVVNSNPNEEPASWIEGPSNFLFGTTIGLSILIGLILLFFAWIMIKLIKWFIEERKKKDNLEYYKFSLDMKQAIINRDRRYIKRRWWSLWILKKRAPIYAETKNGKKLIGYYEGEADKKEGFFIIALYQIYSIRRREKDVLIIPYKLKEIVYKKNDDFSINLVCEGVDETLSSEYFSLLLIENPNKDSKKVFLDYSNQVMEEYFKEYVYRDKIKNLIIESRENVLDATEMNANIQLARKTENNLK